MKWNRKRKVVAIIVCVYCLLWVLTATWGISDVDRAFDREFAVGTVGFAEDPTTVPIQRIEQMANMRDLMDPANNMPNDSGLFRFRTRGVAIAPFVIVDEAATVFAFLGGYGGRRVNLWFFGVTKWWSLEKYWVI
jgi:hypothetical protein